MDSSGTNVKNAKNKIQEYLGENTKRIKNSDNGNITYQSQDGLKEVRFDVGDPAPHQNVHTHVIEYESTLKGKEQLFNEKVYPSDVDPK